MNRPLRGVLLAVMLGAGIVLPEAAQAYGDAGPASSVTASVDVILGYVDPGAAGFVIVTVLGFLAAIGYTARAYLNRMKQLVFRSAREGKAPDSPDE